MICTSPVAVAVPAPNVVGVEYMPAVTLLFAANPEPLSATLPPACNVPSMVNGPFDVGTSGGSVGAPATSRVRVAVGVHVMSTLPPDPVSLKTTEETCALSGVPVTGPDIVAPGMGCAAGRLP